LFYRAPILPQTRSSLLQNTQTEDGPNVSRVTIPRSYCKLLICEFFLRWLLFYTGSHDYRSGYFRPCAGEVLRRRSRREGERLRGPLRRGSRPARPERRRQNEDGGDS